MFSQRVAVHYLDGRTEEVTVDQWSLSRFAVHAQAKGWKVDPSAPGLMAVTMLRFQAWATLHRGVETAKPSFDAWDNTVTEVEPLDDAEPVDPTRPVHLAG